MEPGDEAGRGAVGRGRERVHDGCQQEDDAAVAIDIGLTAERSYVEVIERAVEQVAERAHVRVRKRARWLIDIDVDENVGADVPHPTGHAPEGAAVEFGEHLKGALATKRRWGHGGLARQY